MCHRLDWGTAALVLILVYSSSLCLFVLTKIVCYLAKVVASKGSIRQLNATTTAGSSSNVHFFGVPRPDTWWTGCRPSPRPRPRPEEASGLHPDGRLSSLPQLLLKGSNKQVNALSATRCRYPKTWGLACYRVYIKNKTMLNIVMLPTIEW